MQKSLPLIRLIAIILLIPLWQSPASAQSYYLQYGHDSMGNRTGRSRHLLIRGDEAPSISYADTVLRHNWWAPDADEATPGHGVLLDENNSRRGRLIKTPEQKQAYLDAAIKEVESLMPITTGRPRDITSYDVGAIQLAYGLSPSGARTYSVPILTAPDIKYAPSLSLVYNSQGGHGYGGYGWDIAGVSEIRLASRSLYYDDEIRAASALDTAAVFTLDGVRLVRNDDPSTMATYPLVSASGRILVAPHRNSHGFVSWFQALYPDGTVARYGTAQDVAYQMPSYPIVRSTNLEGENIEYVYSVDTVDGNHTLTQVRYGFNAAGTVADGVITISSTSQTAYSYYAGKKVKRAPLLSGIVSSIGNTNLYTYGLQYESVFGASLLTSITLTNSSDHQLPPLCFTYGHTANPHPGNDSLKVIKTISIQDPDFGNSNHILRRGKFFRGNFNDGLAVYPACPVYSQTGQYSFACNYPVNYSVKYVACLEEVEDVSFYTISDYGFQTLEAVDVDGDGVDELVEVYCNYTGYNGSNLLIKVRKCDADGEFNLSYSLIVQMPGRIEHGINISPYNRTYRWGDFVGNGKTQLLVVNYSDNGYGFSQTPTTTLIDLESGTKLYSGTVCSVPSNEDVCLIALDIDGDTRTEMCFSTTSGLQKYRFTNGTFLLEHTYQEISKTLITSGRVHYSDINADGYIDLVRAAAPGTIWSFYLNTGVGFEYKTLSITNSGTSQFFFFDVNRDGLPDLMKINGTALGYYRNIDGNTFDTYKNSYSTVTNANAILPANVMDYSSMSSFIKIDGSIIKEYGFTSYASEQRHLVQSEDSFGKTVRNAYRYLPNAALNWTENPTGIDSTAGYQLKALPLYVLLGAKGQMTAEGGTSVFMQESYSWYDGVVNNRGLGFCGFSKIKKGSPFANLYYVEVQRFNPQKAGVLVGTYSYLFSDYSTPYSFSIYTYDNHSTTYGKLSPRLIRSVENNNVTGIVRSTSMTYDAYDYPVTVTESGWIGSGDSLWRTRGVVYCHSVDTTRYVLGAVSAETMQTERDGNSATQWYEKTECTYDSLFHPLTRVRSVSQDGSTYNTVSTEQWTYDAHGNILTEESAPYSSEEFIGNTYTYDTSGRHLLTSTDALGHTTTCSSFNVYGSPSTVTDYRNRVTSVSFDSWGNVTGTVHPDGTAEQTVVDWDGVGLYEVTQTRTGSPDIMTDYDALGREVRRSNRRFDGAWQHVRTYYDSKGRVSIVTQPYRGSSWTYRTQYTYDSYGRVKKASKSSGNVTSWSYSGTSVTETVDSVSITRTTNAFGDLVGTADAGGTTAYVLRDDGNPSSVSVTCGTVTTTTTFSYDAYGRRTAIVDPSAGTRTTSYIWNADGTSSTTQTNDKGSITTSLDKYGRVTGITRSGSFNTTYSYDTYGRLVSETSTNSTGEVYTYDAYDRPDTVMQYVPDSKWLRKTYTYGAGSNVASIGYTSQDGYITTESYTYTYGHNTSITLPGGTEVLTLVSENDLGQPTSATSAGISRTYEYTQYGFPTARKLAGGTIQHIKTTFDPATGNLLSRGRYVTGQPSESESFTYDALGRLASTDWGAVTYSSNGNVLSKGGTGTMTYATTGSPYKIDRLYASSASVTQASTQTISYTSFDRPESISEDDYTAAFTYDAGYDRVKMYITNNGYAYMTKYYIGGRYEREEHAGGDTVQRLFLGGDAYNAPMVLQKTGSGSWTPYVIGRDYLGSITNIVNTSGTQVAEYSYDAWGRMRDPQTFSLYAITSEPALLLGRGYCGHEHLPLFGLINMNARLYDPVLGRFLSPDPHVQAPDFTQNFNRYTYALNNPLKFIDESGEVFIPTYRITPNSIRVGLNNGIFGLGISISWENNELWVGGYTEVGPRVENGVTTLAATLDLELMYGTKSRDTKVTVSMNLAAAYGSLSTTAQASYAFLYNKEGELKDITAKVSVKMSIGFYDNLLGISIGYSQAYSYMSDNTTHTISLGFSNTPTLGKASNPYTTKTKYSLGVNYTFRELEAGEDWYDRLSFDFSLSGSYQKQSSKINQWIKRYSYSGWVSKPMISSNSYSFVKPVNSATMRWLYNRFRGIWGKQNDEDERIAVSRFKP